MKFSFQSNDETNQCYFRYIIPGKMISCLYYTALKTKYVYLEDVFVTGILAKSCGYKVRL